MRRSSVLLLAVLLAIGMLMPPALAANDRGQGNDPDRRARSNSLIAGSEPLDVSEVQEQSSDSNADNFEATFNFYRVTYEEISYDTWVYREPNRIGSDNHVVEGLGGATSNRFWYGVTERDEDGVQHEIVHDGTIWQYFETSQGWRHLKAEFDEGELLHVNGQQVAEKEEEPRSISFEKSWIGDDHGDATAHFEVVLTGGDPEDPDIVPDGDVLMVGDAADATGLGEVVEGLPDGCTSTLHTLIVDGYKVVKEGEWLGHVHIVWEAESIGLPEELNSEGDVLIEATNDVDCIADQ